MNKVFSSSSTNRICGTYVAMTPALANKRSSFFSLLFDHQDRVHGLLMILMHLLQEFFSTFLHARQIRQVQLDNLHSALLIPSSFIEFLTWVRHAPNPSLPSLFNIFRSFFGSCQVSARKVNCCTGVVECESRCVARTRISTCDEHNLSKQRVCQPWLHEPIERSATLPS